MPLEETLKALITETDMFYSYTLLQAAVFKNSFTMTEYLIKFVLNKYYYGVLRTSSKDPNLKGLAKEKVREWIHFQHKNLDG